MESFSAPIPGQGLTIEPGSRPWQRPAEFTDVDSVIGFYVPRIYSKLDGLMDLLEQGTAITNIVHPLTMAGVMQGKHTIDVAVLANDVLVDFIAALADKVGVSYKIVNDEAPTEAMVDEAIEIVRAKPSAQDELESEDVLENVEEGAGLMAKRPMPMMEGLPDGV
jgi:hypothetical protein|tara:strand:+ start:973 stop:1467 length:495 start_codon:yes stop_codon:yes gene_type:complete